MFILTKHKLIIDHIKGLKPGTKISVRKIAQDLNVSEGTSYRAIKEAENINIVSTSARVGTVRIELPKKKEIEKLTYKEVANITDGTILGGHEGLNLALNKFVIGAMTIDAMEKYISPSDILIVGNREDVQLRALEKGCAVLISGGFGCSAKVKELSEIKDLPVISSSYDTFTIASLINKAFSEKLIKKDIVLVKDIMIKNPYYMLSTDAVRDWKNMVKDSSHSRFPVINELKRVVGMVTSKDVANVNDDETIDKVMTKEPISISPDSPVAYASQIMIWEGIELIPVEDNDVLVGVLSRQDVIKVLQYSNNQPQNGETIESLILSGFTIERTKKGLKINGKIPETMRSNFGTVSCGSISILMLLAASEAVRKHKNVEILTDSVSIYYIKPAQFNEVIEIESVIIDSGRKNCKVELLALSGEDIIAKGIISVKIQKKNAGGI